MITHGICLKAIIRNSIVAILLFASLFFDSYVYSAGWELKLPEDINEQKVKNIILNQLKILDLIAPMKTIMTPCQELTSLEKEIYKNKLPVVKIEMIFRDNLYVIHQESNLKEFFMGNYMIFESNIFPMGKLKYFNIQINSNPNQNDKLILIDLDVGATKKKILKYIYNDTYEKTKRYFEIYLDYEELRKCLNIALGKPKN
jgi:hypothetical protein